MTEDGSLKEKRANLFGLPVDLVDLAKATTKAMSLIGGPGGYIVTINPEMCLKALEDESFAVAVRSAAMIVPDGIGTVWALKRAGHKEAVKVPGIELAESLISEAARKGVAVYLIGAKPGVAARAAAYLMGKYDALKVAGVKDGYFDFKSAPQVADELAASCAGLALVAMGAGRQEEFMRLATEKAKGMVMIGVGGSFDVFAGDVRRAPAFARKLGLEWLWRGLSQPSRLGRLMKLPEFAWKVLVNPAFAERGGMGKEGK